MIASKDSGPFFYDAFTGPGLRGNPAAVCPLDEWPPDAELQRIAAAAGVSDTAFLVRRKNHYELRWFTPALEIDLCGHATLAAAHWHFTEGGGKGDRVLFKTRQAGDLTVTRAGSSLTLDFPSRPPYSFPPPLGGACPPKPSAENVGVGGRGGRGDVRGPGSGPLASEVGAALGLAPAECLVSDRDYLAVFDTESQVRGLRPDMDRLRSLDRLGVIATAPGSQPPDFVSRYFAPKPGIPEDPVTGSAHSVLAPYWAGRLGKARLHAIQVSERGGEIFCKVMGNRVLLTGRVSGGAQGTA